MLLDTFSLIDPSAYLLRNKINRLWIIINIIPLILLSYSFWIGGNRYNTILRLFLGSLVKWLDSKDVLKIKGMTLIIIRVIILSTTINFLSSLPFNFPLSTSPVVRITLCLPIWFGVMASSIQYAPIKFFCNLVPYGTPLWISPIVVLAELIRLLIRPISHCARITINLSLGHIYLSLSASLCRILMCSPVFEVVPFVSRFILTVFLFCFELFMAFLQTYIFSFLLVIYISDHSK